jgi:hypothetical protein
VHSPIPAILVKKVEAMLWNAPAPDGTPITAADGQLGPAVGMVYNEGARAIHVDVTHQKVKDSPPVVPAETVDGACEELFPTCCGIRLARR